MKLTSRHQSAVTDSTHHLNVYELVTRQVIDLLASGDCPWRKPWSSVATALPVNAVSRREYRGANIWLLGSAPFSDNRWLSFKQAKGLGGSVRKGEHSRIAVFWKLIESKRPNAPHSGEEQQQVPLLRYYSVFNVQQCEGLDLPPMALQCRHERIEAAEALIAAMPQRPLITETGDQAWYMPSQDRVNVPSLNCFESPDSFYATLLHELGHATGHEKRINRKEVTGVVRFGSDHYSLEELVAELTSAFCCASLGLNGSLVANSAAYIQGWIAALNNDPKMFVLAASRAQRAADFIMGRQEFAPEP